jgi:hypothetical protein
MASKAKAKKTVRFVQDKINETDDPNVALAWAIKAVGASHMTAKDDVLIWLETVRSSLNADDVQERQLRNTSGNVTRIELEQIRDELSTKMDKLADMFANGVPNMQANIGNDGGVHGFSYAAAAKTPPVAPRAPKSTKSLELKITLNGLPPALVSELLTLKAFELTKKIEDAIASSDNESVRRTKIQGARMAGKEAIIIRATKNTDAELLGKAANNWLPSVLPGAKIRKPLYQLIIHFVSTEFDPSAEDSIQHLCSSNPHLNLSREMIQSARWLRKPVPNQNKPMSSIILTIDNAKVANDIINRGIRILGMACNAEKVRAELIQYYRCQAYGHQARSCPQPQDTPICARCAGNHSTGTNNCERNCGPTKCADIRMCKHIKFACANCKGTHKAFDKNCPTRQGEMAKLATHPHFHSPYFIPSNENSCDPASQQISQ